MSPWKSLKKWRKFFKKAGIPKDVATNYAIIFHQNDISFDMLYDIDKVRNIFWNFIKELLAKRPKMSLPTSLAMCPFFNCQKKLLKCAPISKV